MKNFDQCRQLIKKAVLQKITPLPGICSVTFVGSFEHADNISVISDIDIIVITDHLTESLFLSIQSAAGSITGKECSLPGYQIRLNMSFGPLKFNEDKIIVFHLMVYDRKSHRKHVIESPFTCFDWEYYDAAYGENLSDIYPVAYLQLDDMLGSRRGLQSYLADLTKGVISFRRYVFEENEVTEQKEEHIIDDRHRKEFAYHIMKFLLKNLYKILKQSNERVPEKEVVGYFNNENSDFLESGIFFLELYNWKHEQGIEPADIMGKLSLFIDLLNKWLHELQNNLPNVSFCRHVKTALNDGTFLGISRDPGILAVDPGSVPDIFFDRVITGSLKRTVETGALLNARNHIQDTLLNEINYGLAEGLNLEELNQHFPELHQGWQRKEDPSFPGGENQRDVALRLEKFIGSLIYDPPVNNTAVVTHNVVIRALLGKYVFKVPVYKWYRICPDHLEPVALRIYYNGLIPALSKDARVKFRDQIVNWK
jgi:hypothetical protein